MHKQNKTNREVGLENIMESMYGRTSEGRLSRGRLANPDGTECDHCKGTGHHHDDKGNQTECEKCGGDGWIKDVVKEAPKPCPKCGKVHTINAGCSKAHEATSWRQHDVDHHNQYMMDQDLLQPLHAAAIEAGAKDINDWMIQQIKNQGENWTSWFIDTVIRGDY